MDSPKKGLQKSAALLKFGERLTLYERKEIDDYPVVYYAGQNCSDKVKAPTTGPNDGYDNPSGEYNILPHDHVAYRYEVLGGLGTGAFGQVVKALDHASGMVVAVKLIRNRRKIANQAKQEVQILQYIRDADPSGRYGLVQMLDTFSFRGHVCIVYELLGINLYDHMKETDFFPMALSTVKQIASRVLISLAFLWKENIVHCDLKPENILLSPEGDMTVKVVDLGSACFSTDTTYTYIQSRFYRAPEVILGLPYERPIDLWSFGCILCELATGYPLFPGENERDQLGCIMEFLGAPPTEMITKSRRKREYFTENLIPKEMTTSKGRVRKPGGKSLAGFLGLKPDHEFVGFVKQFLRWEPGQRATPKDAMRHPWIADLFVFSSPPPPPATTLPSAECAPEVSSDTEPASGGDGIKEAPDKRVVMAENGKEGKEAKEASRSISTVAADQSPKKAAAPKSTATEVEAAPKAKTSSPPARNGQAKVPSAPTAGPTRSVGNGVLDVAPGVEVLGPIGALHTPRAGGPIAAARSLRPPPPPATASVPAPPPAPVKTLPLFPSVDTAAKSVPVANGNASGNGRSRTASTSVPTSATRGTVTGLFGRPVLTNPGSREPPQPYSSPERGVNYGFSQYNLGLTIEEAMRDRSWDPFVPPSQTARSKLKLSPPSKAVELKPSDVAHPSSAAATAPPTAPPPAPPPAATSAPSTAPAPSSPRKEQSSEDRQPDSSGNRSEEGVVSHCIGGKLRVTATRPKVSHTPFMPVIRETSSPSHSAKSLPPAPRRGSENPHHRPHRPRQCDVALIPDATQGQGLPPIGQK